MTRPVASVTPMNLMPRLPVKATGRACPLCSLPTWQRIRGEWCPRCRGWIRERSVVGALTGAAHTVLELDQR